MSCPVYRVVRSTRRAEHGGHPNLVGVEIVEYNPYRDRESVTAALNQSLAVFEMSPVMTVLEHRVVSWMNTLVGFEKGSGGTLTSGDRAGSRYYDVLENVTSSTTAQAWSGALQSGMRNNVTALVLNPFVKIGGVELFGNVETMTGAPCRFAFPAYGANTHVMLQSKAHVATTLAAATKDIASPRTVPTPLRRISSSLSRTESTTTACRPSFCSTWARARDIG